MKQLTKDLLREMYDSDENLINLYHQCAGEGLDSCVNDEWKMLEDNKIYTKLLEREGRIIGYFGIESNNGMQALTSFFIDPTFRKKEYMEGIWKEICDNFCPVFFVGLYEHNTPARKFIERQGGKIAIQDKNKILYVIKQEGK